MSNIKKNRKALEHLGCSLCNLHQTSTGYLSQWYLCEDRLIHIMLVEEVLQLGYKVKSKTCLGHIIGHIKNLIVHHFFSSNWYLI